MTIYILNTRSLGIASNETISTAVFYNQIQLTAELSNAIKLLSMTTSLMTCRMTDSLCKPALFERDASHAASMTSQINAHSKGKYLRKILQVP